MNGLVVMTSRDYFGLDVTVFNKRAKRPFKWAGVPFLQDTSHVCGKEKCVWVKRYKLSESNFNSSYDRGGSSTGQGLPFTGVQPIGHLVGYPSYVHQPFFIHGDGELLDQRKNGAKKAAVRSN